MSAENLVSSNAKDSAPRDVRSSSVKGDILDLDRGVGVGVVNVSGCTSGTKYSCSVRNTMVYQIEMVYR